MTKLGLLPLVLAACTTPADGDLDAYLGSLEHLPSSPSEKLEGEAESPEQTPNMTCVTQPVRETRRHDHVVALAANSESLWAGSLVRGDAVYSGLFTPISLPRAPMTISISLANLAGNHSATLESPTLSAYREALASLLGQTVTGATPANLAVEITKLDSEQQIELALGAGATWNGLVEVKASFDWKAASKKSRYLVKFVQSYFTVDVDAPAHGADVFDPSVSLSDVKAVTGVQNPPVYVSSITYGRTVIFMFESDAASSELGTALDAIYKGPGAAGAMISVRDKDMLSQTKITAYILGGAGGEAVKAIDSIDGLLDFIQSGGDYSPQSPGAPIAYKLAHLADNEPARLSFTQDYAIKNCTAKSGNIRVTFDSITLDGSSGELDGTLDILGVVTANATLGGGGGGTLAAYPRSAQLKLRDNETWPATGIIHEVVFPVSVAANAALDINVNLSDADPGGDTLLGATNYRIDLNGGWQRSFNVVLLGGGHRVLLHFTTQPI